MAQYYPKQLRILAFDPNFAEIKDSQIIFDRIKSHLPAGTKLVIAGTKKNEIALAGILRGKRRSGYMKALVKENRYSGASYETTIASDLENSMFSAVDHLQKRAVNYSGKHHKIDNAYDANHYYHIMLDTLAKFLEREQTNLVLIFDFPHSFYDTLIYQIAKAKGIKTLICRPSFVLQNLFLSLNSIEDAGLFPVDSGDDPEVAHPIELNKYSDGNYVYMKGIKQFQGETGKLCWRGILNLFWKMCTNEKWLLSQPSSILVTINRMRRIAKVLPKWRYPFRKFFNTSHLDYFEYLLSHENNEVDFNRKFVYFPLSMQPEMTTSVLGGCYSDQLLAIEQLAELLPNNHWIYVKENPKQSGVMRGPQFIKRLNQIEKVKILPSYASTHELIDKSVFVATVSGTVGWEAICKGKNALVYGMPWWRSLPGVIQFHEGITFETVCNHKFEQVKLVHAASRLISRMHLDVPRQQFTHSNSEKSPLNTDVFAKVVGDLIKGRIETTYRKT